MQTYTKTEIVALLGIHPNTFENMLKDNRLPDPLPLHKSPRRWNAGAIDQIADAN